MANNKTHTCSCSVCQIDNENQDSHSNESPTSHDESFSVSKSEKLRLAISLVLFLTGLFLFVKFPNIKILSISFSTILFIATWFISGFEVLTYSVKNFFHGQLFDENFLMTVASIGAFVLGEYFEGATVMLLYNVGEIVQSYALTSSRKSISNLVNLQVDKVCVLENSNEKYLTPEKIPVGSLILIKPGEKIPIDGIIETGSALFETSSLTGESLPKSLGEGDEVFSGFISLDGALTIKTKTLFSESATSKVAKLIEQAQSQKANPEKFITRFARVYTPIVTLIAVCLAIFPPLIISFVTKSKIPSFENFSTWVYRSLIFLTISCPCALVISVPLTYFASLGGLAKKGILVKGANFIDNLSKLSACVFDKTGTLTESKLTVSELKPENGFSEEKLLELALIPEKNSTHPIAKAIIEYADKKNISKPDRGENFLEIAGKGVSLELNGKELLVGNEKIFATLKKLDTQIEQKPPTNKTCVYVIYDKVFAGTIFFTDRLRPGATSLVKKLAEVGIKKTAILTGDNYAEAEKTAQALGVSEFYANLLPAEKLEVLKTIIENARKKNKNKAVSFMGDGINDAPALSLADVGISFAGVSSDLALESADLVFLNDNLHLLPKAIRHSKKTAKVVMQNIIFAIGVKVLFLVLGALGYVGMIFAIFADVGVCILAILNSLRARW